MNRGLARTLASPRDTPVRLDLRHAGRTRKCQQPVKQPMDDTPEPVLDSAGCISLTTRLFRARHTDRLARWLAAVSCKRTRAQNALVAGGMELLLWSCE
jgi:hypothetical protein